MFRTGVNGYLVEPDDVNGIANNLIDLLSVREKCKEFGALGYEIFKERYTWDATGQKMKENIDRVLSGNQTGNA